MATVRERLADTSDIQNHSSQVERQPIAAGLKQTVEYVSPTEFAKQKETIEGKIRGWQLYGLQGKEVAAKHDARSEHLRAETSRLNYMAAGMGMLTAQQGVIGAGLQWQTARVQNETARVQLATAKLDLKGAIAEFPLRHQSIATRLEQMKLDITASLQQIAIKREPLSISGALRDAKVPTVRFPSTVSVPNPDGVDAA